MRRKKKSIVGILLAVFCGLLMVSFGLDTVNFQGARTAAAITIDDQEISFRQYSEQVRKIDETFRLRFGENYDMFRKMVNVDQQAIDSLINEILFEKLAVRLGMSTSLPQIEAELRSLPFFAQGFSTAKWKQFLREIQLSESALIQATREQILQQQVSSILAHLATPTEEELEAAYRHQNRQLTFLAATFRYSALEKTVSVDEQKLRAHYDANNPLYLRPRAVKFALLELTPEQFTSAVNIEEEDIVRLYEQEANDFVEPREINAYVLHFQTKESKPESPLSEMFGTDQKPDNAEMTDSAGAEAVKAIAKTVRDQLKAGESFDELARKTVADPAAKARLENLGWKKLEDLPEYLRASAKNIEAMSAAEAVENADGLSILYASEVKERRVKPLSEVRAEVEQRFRAEDAPIYLAEYAENFFERFLGASLPLKELAEQENRSVFQSEGAISGAEPPRQLAMEVFQKIIRLNTNDKQLIHSGDNYYIVEVQEAQEEELRPFEEVQKLVENDFRVSEANRIAHEKVQQLLEVVRKSDNADEIFRAEAEKLGATIKSVGPIARTEAKEDFLSTPENIDAAFALVPESPIAGRAFDSSGQTAAVMLSAVTDKTKEEYLKDAKAFREQESAASGERLSKALLALEKRAADIKISPELTNRALDNASLR